MGRSMDWRILQPAAISLLILLIVLATSEAKVGYSINVDVNGTKWSRSQSTEVLNFRADSDLNGKGNSSKYMNVPGFAGIGLKEITYTKYGKLSDKNGLNITAKLNWIYINENIDDRPANNTTVTQDDGTVVNITVPAKSHYYAEINESIPTAVRSDDELSYSGQGIYSRNSYTNNEDKLFTNYYAKNFSKIARFVGVYTNALVRTDITPGRVSEIVMKNSTTAFRLLSLSDRYTRLKYQTRDAFSDEEYVGRFKIDRKFSNNNRFRISSDYYWLDCCSPDMGYMQPSYWNCGCIFDARDPAYLVK